MKEIETDKLFKAAEVKLTYVTKQKPSERIKISDSQDASELFFEIWDWSTIEHVEEVKIALLNRGNKLLGVATISKGGTTGTVIDIKIIMQYVIKSNANSIILAHNHPSGNLNPSGADKTITNKIRDALRLFDISLIDHIIITPDRNYASILEVF
jgi:DNA repair protein RadC